MATFPVHTWQATTVASRTPILSESLCGYDKKVELSTEVAHLTLISLALNPCEGRALTLFNKAIPI